MTFHPGPEKQFRLIPLIPQWKGRPIKLHHPQFGPQHDQKQRREPGGKMFE
jgi:hypothetical protein